MPKCSPSAEAHLRFVTIHPFDDGNSRIARAIADMALSRSEGSPQRFYSMSSQIRQERNDYYDILERARNFPISERQRLVINRMLEGFESRTRPQHELFSRCNAILSLIVSDLENEDPLPALAPMARPEHLEFHQFDPRWEHLRLRAPYHRRHPPGD